MVFWLRNCEGATCLLSKCLLTYYVPGTVLGTGDIVVSRIDKTCLPSLSLSVWRRGQKINETQYTVHFKVINAYM